MASDELHVELRQLIDRAHAEQDEPQHLLDFGRRVLDVLFAPSNLLPHDDELALLRLVSELTLPHTVRSLESNPIQSNSRACSSRIDSIYWKECSGSWEAP